MSSQKDHESMKKLDQCYRVVQQSSPKGIRAVEIAGKLGIHRTTVHRYLTSLELMGKVENTGGIWRAKTGEHTIAPLEKEIVIQLPTPKNQWFNMARLDMHAKYSESLGMPRVAEMERTIIQNFNETRTIRITGRNVDDLDIEKLGNLIQQATEKSSKFNFKGLFKGLKWETKKPPEKSERE
jgi:DNA-binding transcriptional regulator LsrR (DeoR family)